MIPDGLMQDISSLRGVGPAIAARLARLGVSTVRDLLLLLPRAYEDRSAIVPLAQASLVDKACVVATVVAVADLGWGRGRTLKATVTDNSAEAVLLCFGRAFSAALSSRGGSFSSGGASAANAGSSSVRISKSSHGVTALPVSEGSFRCIHLPRG